MAQKPSIKMSAQLRRNLARLSDPSMIRNLAIEAADTALSDTTKPAVEKHTPVGTFPQSPRPGRLRKNWHTRTLRKWRRKGRWVGRRLSTLKALFYAGWVHFGTPRGHIKGDPFARRAWERVWKKTRDAWFEDFWRRLTKELDG